MTQGRPLEYAWWIRISDTCASDAAILSYRETYNYFTHIFKLSRFGWISKSASADKLTLYLYSLVLKFIFADIYGESFPISHFSEEQD